MSFLIVPESSNMRETYFENRVWFFSLLVAIPLLGSLQQLLVEGHVHRDIDTIAKGGGPKMTPEDAAKVVLGEAGPGLDAYKTAYPGYDAHMPAYRYHFLTHSKPATHLRAFAHLDDEKLETALPDIYRKLLTHISDNLKRD